MTSEPGDIYDNLLVIDSVLEDEGYELVLEQDSKAALSMVEELTPDLILLDIMMPDIDGYEFTRRIRRNQNLSFIPILLITAHEQSDAVMGLDIGADEFIRKPIDPHELQARVRSLLRLKHSIDERDRMTNLRQDFVSRFTHDLKIPLVASNRILKLMGEGRFCEVTPDFQEIVNSMISSNDDLLHMVYNLLEIYRHEAGCKNLNFANCNIHELLKDVIQQLEALAEEKGLGISFSVKDQSQSDPSDESENNSTDILIGDRIELRRVLTNIIGNAIKFTDTGSINIYLQSTATYVSIEVQDTGTGISEKEQAVLFNRFRQGKHKNSGSGLGLYLSQCIVEAHQGNIDVRSELGKGSLFTITLPKSMER
ncbi:MAG: hybrid sensor histidine kinase/response regulator [Cyanobacteria bacterium P01_A01_bin.84]